MMAMYVNGETKGQSEITWKASHTNEYLIKLVEMAFWIYNSWIAPVLKLSPIYMKTYKSYIKQMNHYYKQNL